ncbi:hypothetical protein GCM10023085_55300 [Actinomadura viridis]|uniref:Uncharacterized protein n=1 Tax=Actinomadura viridis TaxID=58110 RepID=A0A931DDA9_9ACTN|nr:hypothetical protein [Actinomadura viridis]MBG6086488.1 hypothetical protein [Actinomadura viridis]
MTERSQGGPDPAEPSTRGAAFPTPPSDAPPTASAPGGSTERPAATAPPGWDLTAVRRTDALLDALAGRGAAATEAAAGTADPAVRLLHALIRDVDEEPPRRQASPGERPSPPNGPRRRGSRTIVALGVAGAVLAGSGVAAAGGEPGDAAQGANAAGTPPGAYESGPGRAEAGKADASAALRPGAPVTPRLVVVPAAARDDDRHGAEAQRKGPASGPGGEAGGPRGVPPRVTHGDEDRPGRPPHSFRHAFDTWRERFGGPGPEFSAEPRPEGSDRTHRRAKKGRDEARGRDGGPEQRAPGRGRGGRDRR